MSPKKKRSPPPPRQPSPSRKSARPSIVKAASKVFRERLAAGATVGEAVNAGAAVVMGVPQGKPFTITLKAPKPAARPRVRPAGGHPPVTHSPSQWKGVATVATPDLPFGDKAMIDTRTPSAATAAASLEADLAAGVEVTKSRVAGAMKAAFGGTMAAGDFTAKDGADVLELAVSLSLTNNPGRYDPTVGPARAKRTVADLAEIVAGLPTQNRRDEEMEKFQQFSTPPHYAYVVAWVANLERRDVVVEPSAGTGHLCAFAVNAGCTVFANEISERRATLLRSLPLARVFTENAEQLDNVLDPAIVPDVVLMNPPFSAAGTRMAGQKVKNAGCHHVDQALLRLRDGGRLVTVIGDGMGNPGWWQSLRERYTLRASVGIPGNEYKKYGTTFPTRIVVIDKCGPTTSEPIVQDVEGVAAAVDALAGVRQGRARAAEAAPARKLVTGSLFGPEEPTPQEAATPSTSETLAGMLRGALGLPAPAPKPPRAARPQFEPAGRTIVAAPVVLAARAVADDVAARPLTDSVFEPYHPQRLRVHGAQDHPTPLVESAAMASVLPPVPTYAPCIPLDLIESGRLSAAQLEPIVYAGQAHSRHLEEQVVKDPETGDETRVAFRQGYFIGDGTGVGKGREFCGIILDSFARGRRKAIWVSMNDKLIVDAARDWTDLGGRKEEIIDLSKIKPSEPIRATRGILFVTYGTLKSDRNGHSRLKQVVAWAQSEPDLVVGFDEAHAMKSAIEQKKQRGKSKVSQAALAGCDLQFKLPDARVVYLSATGATEVFNLAYAERLGLWGRGTAFPNKASFVSSIEGAGLGAMELVARDLKQRGLYCARGLSFAGVEYARLVHTLEPHQRVVYDKLCEAWQLVLSKFNEALELTAQNGEGKIDGKAKGAAYSKFWGAHQRFFNQILVAMQMPSVLRDIDRILAEGVDDPRTPGTRMDACAVLQLVNTQEAMLQRQIDKLGEGDDLSSIDMTPRDMLIQLIQHCFPVAQLEEYSDGNGQKRMRPVKDQAGNPVLNRQAVKERDTLLTEVGSISCPDGPIEMVLNHFGYENVAEVTGRSVRVVRKRNAAGEEEQVRESRSPIKAVAEAGEFQDGKRLVLIFSDAGGTGQSYHASRAVRNQRRRVHYMVQPGWVADRAVQGLGRTHRSNQIVPPLIQLVSTDLNGQKRFISTIARRLETLGAMTRGQRQASGQGLFSTADNLESEYARAALYTLYRDVHAGRVRACSLEAFEAETGLYLTDGEGGGLAEDLPPVTRFLNRLLSLKITRQNELFDEYQKRINANVAAAMEAGTFDRGVETVWADSAVKASEQVVYTDPKTGAETKHVRVQLKRKAKLLDFDTLMEEPWEYLYGRKIAFFAKNLRSGRVYAFTDAGERTNTANGRIVPYYYQIGPNVRTPVVKSEIDRPDYWQRVSPKLAASLWEEQRRALPPVVEESLDLLTGAVLPIWDRLKGTPRVKRLQLDDGDRLLGRVIPQDEVEATMQRLGVKAEVTYSVDEVARSLAAGTHYYTLANGWVVKPCKVAGERRIECTGPDFQHNAALKADGLFFERDSNWKSHWYVPVDDAATVIGRLTSSKPVVKGVRLAGGDSAAAA